MPRGSFLNLLTLKPDELEGLRRRSSEHNGVARIIVHPFFESYHPLPFRKRDPERFLALNPRVRLVEKMCRRLASDTNAPPLIIFEEGERLNDTKTRLRRNARGNTIYFVPTIAKRGIPRTAPLDEPSDYPETSEDLKEAWDAVVRPLRLAGVRSLIVGGMLFEVVRDRDRPPVRARNIGAFREARRQKGVTNLAYDVQGCVAQVLKEMHWHFPLVQISGVSHPHSYLDLLRIERERIEGH